HVFCKKGNSPCEHPCASVSIFFGFSCSFYETDTAFLRMACSLFLVFLVSCFYNFIYLV
ncbi:hypothetical protein ACJX0J_009107, partial [Zea mays]